MNELDKFINEIERLRQADQILTDIAYADIDLPMNLRIKLDNFFNIDDSE